MAAESQQDTSGPEGETHFHSTLDVGQDRRQEWDLAISKDKEESQLSLEQLENYRTPKLIPLAVCWVTEVGKLVEANGSVLCLCAGWLAAESYYVAQTGL